MEPDGETSQVGVANLNQSNCDTLVRFTSVARLVKLAAAVN